MQGFGIIGRSYCGSTLLNYLLGSHPEVYGGSELWRLLGRPRVRCAVCGPDCAVWSRSALAAAKNSGPEGLYNYLRELTGRPVICDASKLLSHFRQMPAEPSRWAVVVKHPLRHVTSYIVNQLYRRDGKESPAARGIIDDDDLAAFAADRLASIARLPASIERNRAWLAARGDIIHLKYEDLVTDPTGTLTRLLGGTGLDYRPEMLDYARRVHHPIGGNRGPHAQARRANGRDDGGGPPLRQEFYRSDGIRMDDKWREALTDRQIALVTSLPGYDRACEFLGYPSVEDPRCSASGKVGPST